VGFGVRLAWLLEIGRFTVNKLRNFALLLSGLLFLSCAHLFGHTLSGMEVRLVNWESPKVFFESHIGDEWRQLDSPIMEGSVLVFRETLRPEEMVGRMKIEDKNQTVILVAYRGDSEWATFFRTDESGVVLEREQIKVDFDSFFQGILKEEARGNLPVTVLTISKN